MTAERLDARRRAHDAGDPIGADQLLLPPPPSRRNLYVVLVGVLAIGVTVQVAGTGSPDVATSCEKAAFALSEEEVALSDPVQWTVTGPDDGAYFLALDVAEFTAGPDGTFTSVPYAGRERAKTQQLSEDIDVGDDCRDSGVFGVLPPVEPGSHTVSLFRRTPGRIERVADTPLRLTADAG